jgi:hypothetical protein
MGNWETQYTKLKKIKLIVHSWPLFSHVNTKMKVNRLESNPHNLYINT